MPTTIYDSSQQTKRLNNKTIAKSFFTNMEENTVPSKPYLGIQIASIVNNAILGKKQEIRKCDGSYNIDYGCPCPQVISTIQSGGGGGGGDSSGNSTGLWATYFDSLTRLDESNSVITDSLGNVYIVGRYRTNDPSGTRLYNAFGNSQSPSLYTLRSTVNNAIFIVKYDTSGQVIWATCIDGTSISDNGLSIKLDSSNNIYVAGIYATSSDQIIYNASGTGQALSSYTLRITSLSSAFLIKYDNSGQCLWATCIDGALNDFGNSITIDSSDNIYMTGTYNPDTSGNIIYDVSGTGQTLSSKTLLITLSISSFIVQYNSSGICQWATCLDENQTSISKSITLYLNFIYITGQYSSSSSFKLYDASGNTQDISLISLLQTTTSTDSVFIIQYNLSGICQWATCMNTDSVNNIGNSITTDTLGNVYIVGNYNSMDPSGVIIYNRNGNSQISSPNITLIGGVSQTTTFLLKYNSSGICQWATLLDGSDNNEGLSIVSDSNNNIYITGYYKSSVIIYDASNLGGQNTSQITLIPGSNGNQNICILKYNSSGIAQWASVIVPTGGSNKGNSITLDINNNILITGTYQLTATLYNAQGTGQVASSITLGNVSGGGAFLAKYNNQ